MTNPIIELNAHTLAAAFAATEFASANANRDAFLESLALFDNDFDRLAEICLDDASDNLFDDYATLFYRIADIRDMTELESDAIADTLLDLISDDDSYEIIHRAIANAYETEFQTKY